MAENRPEERGAVRPEQAPKRVPTDAELVQEAARKAELALAEQDPAEARELVLKQRQEDAKRVAQQAREQAALSPQERAALAEAESIEASLEPLGETIPGGKYLIGADAAGRGGILVNAEGKEIDEQGKVKGA